MIKDMVTPILGMISGLVLIYLYMISIHKIMNMIRKFVRKIWRMHSGD